LIFVTQCISSGGWGEGVLLLNNRAD